VRYDDGEDLGRDVVDGDDETISLSIPTAFVEVVVDQGPEVFATSPEHHLVTKYLFSVLIKRPFK
jgi:hypothetical protein